VCWVGVLFVTSIKCPSKVAYSFFFSGTSFEMKTALFWVITPHNNLEERSSHLRNPEITQVSKWVCLPPYCVPRVDNNSGNVKCRTAAWQPYADVSYSIC